MPGLVTKKYGTGDYRWLLNTDAWRFTDTVTLDPSTFTAGTHYPNGFFPCGLILNIADKKSVKPFTGGAGEILGFLDGDVATDGNEKLAVAVFVRGQIKTGLLPVKTNLPTTAPNGFYFTPGV